MHNLLLAPVNAAENQGYLFGINYSKRTSSQKTVVSSQAADKPPLVRDRGRGGGFPQQRVPVPPLVSGAPLLFGSNSSFSLICILQSDGGRTTSDWLNNKSDDKPVLAIPKVNNCNPRINVLVSLRKLLVMYMTVAWFLHLYYISACTEYVPFSR